MWKRFWLYALISILLACGIAFALVQSNGRNYTAQTVIFGEQVQTSNDSGVNGVVLSTPIKIGSTYYWLAQLTASASQNPGAAGISGNLNGTCTGTGGLFSKYDVSATFPSSWSTSGTQTFCYSEYVVLNQDGTVAQLWVYVLSPDNTANMGTAIYNGTSSGPTSKRCATSLVHTWSLVAGWNNLTPTGCGNLYSGPGSLGSNGRNYTGQYQGSNGRLYAHTESPDVYIDFAGLTNGSAPTTTQLNNSTHPGGSCTWAVTNPNSNLTGYNAANFPPPFNVSIVGGAGFYGGSTMALQNTAGTSGSGYVGCALAALHSTMIMAFLWTTDISNTETGGHDYDSPNISSTDGTNTVGFNVTTSGQSLQANLECVSSNLGTTVSTDGIPLLSGTAYEFQLLLTSGGGLNYGAVVNPLTHQQVGVTISCTSGASGTGKSPQNIQVGVVGSETEQSGSHNRYGYVRVFWTNTAAILPI